MTATTTRATFGAIAPMAGIAILLSLLTGVSEAQVIINSNGFESPTYSTTFDAGGDPGRLEGQGGFTRSSTGGFPTGAGNVQTTVVKSGSQAVALNRMANSDDRWGVSVSATPNVVNIDWDMRVEDAMGPAGVFGPFFGVEVNDASGGPVNTVAGFGVDGTTGDVLYQAGGTGFLTDTGSSVTFGAWNHFTIKADYTANTYDAFLNNILIVDDEGFVDGALTGFTDAPLVALAAAADATSQAITGTAYFDNYTVSVPEPASLVLALFGLTFAFARCGRHGYLRNSRKA